MTKRRTRAMSKRHSRIHSHAARESRASRRMLRISDSQKILRSYNKKLSEYIQRAGENNEERTWIVWSV